jgi:hypothetical protein
LKDTRKDRGEVGRRGQGEIWKETKFEDEKVKRREIVRCYTINILLSRQCFQGFY